MRTFIKRRPVRRSRGRSFVGAVLALVILVAVAAVVALRTGVLVIERAEGDDGTVADAVAADTSRSAGDVAPNALLPGAPPAESPAPDSMSGIRPTAPPAPAAGATPPADTAAADRRPAGVEPTAAEIDALRAQLIIPVAGVRAADLFDSFDDARGTRRHDALDIAAPRGTAVVSAAPGRLLRLFTSEAGGLMVYATDSTERFVLMYGHLDAYAPGLRDGMPLTRGQALGTVGTTGNAPPTVPHLHFAIARNDDLSNWWTGTPVNPYPLLKR